MAVGNQHFDVIKWKHFPSFWPFVRGIHRSTVDSPHKGQWRGALMFSLMFSLICLISLTFCIFFKWFRGLVNCGLVNHCIFLSLISTTYRKINSPLFFRYHRRDINYGNTTRRIMWKPRRRKYLRLLFFTSLACQFTLDIPYSTYHVCRSFVFFICNRCKHTAENTYHRGIPVTSIICDRCFTKKITTWPTRWVFSENLVVFIFWHDVPFYALE